MPPRLYVRALALIAVITCARIAQAQTAPSPDDVKAGGVMFGQMCVTCHGFGGGGGAGPPLTRPKLVNAPDEAALRSVIGEGTLADRGMPRIRRFTPDEMRQIVAYVQSLGRVAPERVKGNAASGAKVYAAQGCGGCHMVNGQGGVFGPELSDIGRLRGAAYIRQALLDPGAMLPSGTLPIPSRGYKEYLPVRVTAADGKIVTGVRLNEDVFTIQLRDASGRMHSFRKSEAKSIQKEEGISLMPSYSNRIKGDDLDDLVGYLSTLGGTR